MSDSDPLASVNNSPRESSRGSSNKANGADDPTASSNVAMVSPLMSPPPLYSANDYGIETICYTPKLVKSLMHRKVIRISSGGVHNICIVEAKPSCILKDVYMAFMQREKGPLEYGGQPPLTVVTSLA